MENGNDYYELASGHIHNRFAVVLNVLCAQTHTHKIEAPITVLLRGLVPFSHFQPLVVLRSIVDTKVS